MINKSFTLIEVVVAVFLLTVGTVGSFSLIQRTIALTTVSASRLQAAYLAQEGIEIIRNDRDTNYLEGADWDNGIDSSEWREVIFLDGSQSKFQRQITIDRPEPEDKMMTVTSAVKWQQRGTEHQINVQTKLYNWR